MHGSVKGTTLEARKDRVGIDQYTTGNERGEGLGNEDDGRGMKARIPEEKQDISK